MKDNDDIKLGSLNFEGSDNSFESSFYNNFETSKNNTSEEKISLNENLDEMGFSQYTRTAEERKKDFNEDLVHFNVEKPDDKKVQKYTLVGAVIFFVIVL